MRSKHQMAEMLTRTRQPAPARRAERRSPHVEPRIIPRSAVRTSEQHRARRDAGPRDLALYSCGCGNDFEAGVSTSVACPRCGAGQAW